MGKNSEILPCSYFPLVKRIIDFDYSKLHKMISSSRRTQLFVGFVQKAFQQRNVLKFLSVKYLMIRLYCMRFIHSKLGMIFQDSLQLMIFPFQEGCRQIKNRKAHAATNIDTNSIRNHRIVCC
ncbi:hypothetical protein D9M72_624440 [compost metagenome]